MRIGVSTRPDSYDSMQPRGCVEPPAARHRAAAAAHHFAQVQSAANSGRFVNFAGSA